MHPDLIPTFYVTAMSPAIEFHTHEHDEETKEVEREVKWRKMLGECMTRGRRCAAK